jgi:hypothetical protein
MLEADGTAPAFATRVRKDGFCLFSQQLNTVQLFSEEGFQEFALLQIELTGLRSAVIAIHTSSLPQFAG